MTSTGTDARQHPDVVKALALLDAHAIDADQMTRLYESDDVDLIASGRLADALKSLGRGMRLNFAAKVVDAELHRLQVVDVSTVGTVDNEGGEDPAARLWAANQMGEESVEAIRWSITHGDGYLLVSPGEDDDQHSRIVFHEKGEAVVVYDDEHPTEPLFGAKIWTTDRKLGESVDDRVRRLNIYYRDRVARFVEVTKGVFGGLVEDADSGVEYVIEPAEVFRLYEADELGDHEDPYDEGTPDQVPMFHLRTQRPYGRSRLKPAVGPQNIIEKVGAVDSSVVEFSGYPQRFFLMDPEQTSSEFADWDEDDDDIDDDEALRLTAGPGRVWTLTARQAGEFKAAPANEMLSRLDWYVDAMAQLTDTPNHRFKWSGQPPSGESLKAADAPLTARCRDDLARFDPVFVDALVYALALEGVDVESVTVTWAPLDTNDDLGKWQAAKAKLDAGVPLRQVLIEAGYGEELVDEWIAEADDSARFDRLTTLAMVGGPDAMSTDELRSLAGVARRNGA